MENEKNNKGKNRVLILLIIIIVILLTLVILFATGIISFKFDNSVNDSSKNNVTTNDNVNISLSIDNVEVEKDAINSSMAVTGTLNLSYNINKYAGVALSGYCLGNSGEKYLVHGPGNGHVLFGNGEQVLYLSEDIPQDVVYPDGTSKSLQEIDWNNVKIKYCKIDKMTAVLKEGTDNPQIELNFEKSFNSDESNITNSKTNESNNELNQTSNTIASELKSRRFMAKNSIDIDSKALFMKVSDNLYLIEVEYNNVNDQALKTDFLVTYKDGKVIFDKLEEGKHYYDKYIDVKNNILKTEIIMKELDNFAFYYISTGTFDVKETMAKSVNDNSKFLYNGNLVSESEYKSKYSNYEKYSFIKFEDNAVELNEENINTIVK